MRFPRLFLMFLILVVNHPSGGRSADGNRLTYLDDAAAPYYVSRTFPKLTTPQWVGESGVEAVVVLAIDDMRDTQHYENYLRPILDRLKQIDGRAPLSIMTNQVDPQDQRLQRWIEEGVTIEVHTVDHPCPLLKAGNFGQAKSTYDRCVDLLATIPGNHPVAFRMPCCDSLNTPSPRFWLEIFNRRTPAGNYLAIDSSVFNVFTSADSQLPAELTRRPDGTERFRHYLPFPSFVNTIENYPYPYVIGQKCWEFPCTVPSDWQGQNIQRPNNPETLRDLKLALDATVLKQGVMNLVFHPHGWIRNDQVIEFIDHATGRYGDKIKFLNFREAVARINRHLLGGQPLRDARGDDNGVRLLDLDHDGFLDVVVANSKVQQTRTWSPQTQSWQIGPFPATLRGAGPNGATRLRFGVLASDGQASCVGPNLAWHYRDGAWQPDPTMHRGLPPRDEAEPAALAVRLRDVDGDGRCEWLDALHGTVYRRDHRAQRWLQLPFTIPDPRWPGRAAPGARIADLEGGDTGLRFHDVDRDGDQDVLFSNPARYGLYLFESLAAGWATAVVDNARREKTDAPAFPSIVRPDGTDNGAWFHSEHLWVQNEDTDRHPDLVDRLSLVSTLEAHYREQDRQGKLPGPRSPQQSLASIDVGAGFRVELIASEPLIADPVAFDWAPDGSLWVAEMADYPNGINWHKPGDPLGAAGGRIKRLRDTTGDGRYDQAIEFLDQVPFPNGIKAWRGGVLITAAPDILFAEDTDGDGRADRREVLYRGFGEGNQQHRVNGLRWGLDNWLYAANGDSGGTVTSVKTGIQVPIRGRDLRIRPDQGHLAAQSGQTQFGRNRDDWGNWFGGNNSNPMWHYVLDDYYLSRNPYLTAPPVRQAVSVAPGAVPVFPTSRSLARFNDPAKLNRFTSACSPMIYRDSLLFPSTTQAFICEPVHNLVHREIVTRKGLSFRSQRAADEQQSEFFASRDNWCRPVMIRTGPDGALWIADMYRLVIEHPEWIPKDWQQRIDLRAGSDRGRLYRVVPAARAARAVPQLDRLDTAGLVAQLESPNGWIRDTVQQMLLWKSDPGATVHLRRMSSSPTPTARLHALCTLDGLGELRPSDVGAALTDRHPGVRRHAARLAHPLIADSAPLRAGVAALARDPDLAVQLQVAYTLGATTAIEPAITTALVDLMLAPAGQPYLQAAALSSVASTHLRAVLTEVFERPDAEGVWPLVERLLSMAVSIRDTKAIQPAMTAVLSGERGTWSARAALLTRLLATGGGKQPMLDQALTPVLRRQLETFMSAARSRLDSEDSPNAERLVALRLVAARAAVRDLKRISRLLDPQQTPALQTAAVEALIETGHETIPELLLASWRSRTPALRTQILDGLLSRPAWTGALLTALETQRVSPRHLDARRRQQLSQHRDKATRARARELLELAISKDRAEVLADYRPALDLPGKREPGRALFAKHCSKCHRLEGAGEPVGPDLTALTDKSPMALLTAILDPNRAVEDKYLDYLLITVEGRQVGGMLTQETGNSITLRGPDGKQQVVLRRDIDRLLGTGKSLMPEGVERELKPHDVAHLIAYLRDIGPPPKPFPGNQPEIVSAGADRSLHLSASRARIYGPTLVFEDRYRNLGFWSDARNRAVWSVRVPAAGRYRVVMRFACAEETAGNRFQLAVAGQRLTGKVASTGSWDDYRSQPVGTVELPAGTSELSFRSDGAVRGFLIDLLELVLKPDDPPR